MFKLVTDMDMFEKTITHFLICGFVVAIHKWAVSVLGRRRRRTGALSLQSKTLSPVDMFVTNTFLSLFVETISAPSFSSTLTLIYLPPENSLEND